MGEIFSILLSNHTHSETGKKNEVWLQMPSTKEQLQKALKIINITDDNSQDFFINDFKFAKDYQFDIKLDMIRKGSIDELNYLASLLEMYNESSHNKFAAAVSYGEHTENLKELVNLAQNLNCYQLHTNIKTKEEYGYYLIDKMETIKLPEEAKKYFMYEQYVNDIVSREDGKFTKNGYIYNNKNKFRELYNGQNVPPKYCIMNYSQSLESPVLPTIEKSVRDSEKNLTKQLQSYPVIPIVLNSNNQGEKVKEITQKMEMHIKQFFDSDNYKNYLNIISQFNNYSFRNTVLIAMQKPDASFVKGYETWKNEFKRHVRMNEKGIKIIAPLPYKIKKEIEKIDPQTNKLVIGKDDKPITEEVEINVANFRVVTVFDISQTEGQELTNTDIKIHIRDIEHYKDFIVALEKVSQYKIDFEKIQGASKSHTNYEEKRIAIQEGMDKIQTLKTAVHEIANTKLHDIDLNIERDEQQKHLDRHTREVQAESIAYTVCQYYGLDTSDYLFTDIANWSKGKDTVELKHSLETIYKTSVEIINSVDGYFNKLQKGWEQDISKGQEQLQSEKSSLAVNLYKGTNYLEKLQQNIDMATPNKKKDFTFYNDNIKRLNRLSERTPQGLEHLRELINYAAQSPDLKILNERLMEICNNLYQEQNVVRICSANNSNCVGMVALFGKDNKVYIGREKNYDNHGHYNNNDNSLVYVSDNEKAYFFISGYYRKFSLEKALKKGIYTQADYEEFAHIYKDVLSQFEIIQGNGLYFNEKPFILQYNSLATDEKSIEQNYNKIDGAINNTSLEEFTKSMNVGNSKNQIQGDIVKEETNINDIEIPTNVQFSSELNPTIQPIVTIIWSESDKLYEGQQMTLAEANRLFGELDANHQGDGYDKTKFLIECTIQGERHNYEGQQDFGDGDGTLIEHIKKFNESYKDDKAWENTIIEIEGMEAWEKKRTEYEQILNIFVPYLQLHCEFSVIEQIVIDKFTAITSEQESKNLSSHSLTECMAWQTYIAESRKELNTAIGEYNLPPIPNKNDFINIEYKAYKKHVESEIKQEALDSGMTVEEYANRDYEPRSIVEMRSACQSNYTGMLAMVDMNDKVYLGKIENYNGKNYDNRDLSLCFVSENKGIYPFLFNDTWEKSQVKMLEMDDYKEFVTLQQGILRNFEQCREILFAGNPFKPLFSTESLQEQVAVQDSIDNNDTNIVQEGIESVGIKGISSDDPNAVQKLQNKLEKLEKMQETMKKVNAYYRKNKTLDNCPYISSEQIEKLKIDMVKSWHVEPKPYQSFELENNGAEIRRLKKRIKDLSQREEMVFVGWKFEGGSVKANVEKNRLQISFEEKPNEKVRSELTKNGFRWSPKAKVWQRQLNFNAYIAAGYIEAIQPLTEEKPRDLYNLKAEEKEQEKPSILVQLSKSKQKVATQETSKKINNRDLEV